MMNGQIHPNPHSSNWLPITQTLTTWTHVCTIFQKFILWYQVGCNKYLTITFYSTSWKKITPRYTLKMSWHDVGDLLFWSTLMLIVCNAAHVAIGCRHLNNTSKLIFTSTYDNQNILAEKSSSLWIYVWRAIYILQI